MTGEADESVKFLVHKELEVVRNARVRMSIIVYKGEVKRVRRSECRGLEVTRWARLPEVEMFRALPPCQGFKTRTYPELTDSHYS